MVERFLGCFRAAARIISGAKFRQRLDEEHQR